MRHSIARNTFLFSVLAAYMGGLPILGAQTQNGSPQAATAATSLSASAQPASLCANRPLCYEAGDFVATITEFRTSTDPYHGLKVIDAMVHFQNKTNQPISLAYVDGSGSALDDMGNRLGLNTYGGGVRGIGVVAGNQMDPKFTLPPGGGGDARFEMLWSPRGQLSGVNYEMEFSLREMNRVEGNQWTLGAENLIHYQGLANGMGVAPITGGNSFTSGSGATSAGGAVSPAGSALGALVPGQNSASAAPVTYVAAGQPCPPGTGAAATTPNLASAVAGQNQNQNQNQNPGNAVANATAAISSLGSLFGKKKAQPATTANSAGVIPCVATATTAPGLVTNAAGSGAIPQTAGAAAPRNASSKALTQPATTPTTTPRTTAPTATTVNKQTSPRVATNASLKQPASTANASKPSPAKPAAAKPNSSATTTSTQAH